jgi:hypothetical protein
MAAIIDQFCASYRRPSASIVLDIDDTFDAVHGHQQMSLFNAHYDERCFLPIHIHEGGSGKPVAMILREGKTQREAQANPTTDHRGERTERKSPPFRSIRVAWLLVVCVEILSQFLPAHSPRPFARPCRPSPAAHRWSTLMETGDY